MKTWIKVALFLLAWALIVLFAIMVATGGEPSFLNF